MGREVLFTTIDKINLKNKSSILEIQGDGSETGIHIDDFVEGFDIALMKGKHLDIINIGNDREIKILELVKMILKL